MGFPQIPESKYRPSLNETIIDLLESIALEEIAISHLLNAEAEKIQAFVGKCLNFPSKPKNQEIIQFNFSVKQLTDTLLMKEWLLLKKLETVTQIKSKFHGHEERREHHTPSKQPHHDKDQPCGERPNPKYPSYPEDWDGYEEDEECEE